VEYNPRACGGNHKAGSTARQRQQGVFGKQLTRQARAGRSERQPDGEFPVPACTSREKQIRYVGARDQEHERHGHQKGQHCGSQALHLIFR
jgi:hypothetical protein